MVVKHPSHGKSLLKNSISAVNVATDILQQQQQQPKMQIVEIFDKITFFNLRERKKAF